jgi:GntR family transcriptional regulator, transcriptional repressor for pyruvate dehydrogenase complex
MLAQNATPEKIKELRDVIQEERAAQGDPNRLGKASAAFHDRLVELAGNETLAVVSGVLNDIVVTHHSTVLADEIERSSGRIDGARGLRAHERFVDLIEARDVEGAREFWLKHMNEAAKLMLRTKGGTRLLDILR